VEIKKGWMAGIIILLIIFVVPIVYAGFLDVINKGFDSITGKTSQALSASITVGNNAPNITQVFPGGLSFSPTNGGLTEVEVSFEANDAEGTSNLDNSTARVNVSYQSLTGAGLLSDTNTSCSSSNLDIDTINYSCMIQLEYFWDHSTEWTVDAQVQDTNTNFALNSSNLDTNGQNWTVTELVASNFSDTSLAWSSVAPSDTNASSTTNLTMENTGNSRSLILSTTTIDLAGADFASSIPAINFTVFNVTDANKIECDYTNQSEAVSSGVNPFVGVNNSAFVWLNNTLKRGQGTAQESANYCLFDVGAVLTNQQYGGGTGDDWDLTTGDSGE